MSLRENTPPAQENEGRIPYLQKVLADFKKVSNPELTEFSTQNALTGIRNYSLGSLERYENDIFSLAFGHFFADFRYSKPERRVHKVVTSMLGISSRKESDRFENTTEEFRRESSRKVMPIAYRQARLLDNLPWKINLFDTDLKMSVCYEPTIWDNACGAVCFYLSDTSCGDIDIPAYTIRGIPGGIRSGTFEITSVQPWLSELKPGICDFVLCGPEDEIISERQRLADKLERYANRGSSTAAGLYRNLRQEDIFLLSALVYLQKNYIRKFWGLEHSKVLAVMEGKSLNVNYDDLYKLWFTRSTEAKSRFGWNINCDLHGIYIPNFNNLPAGMRSLLMSVNDGKK